MNLLSLQISVTDVLCMEIDHNIAYYVTSTSSTSHILQRIAIGTVIATVQPVHPPNLKKKNVAVPTANPENQVPPTSSPRDEIENADFHCL